MEQACAYYVVIVWMNSILAASVSWVRLLTVSGRGRLLRICFGFAITFRLIVL